MPAPERAREPLTDSDLKTLTEQLCGGTLDAIQVAGRRVKLTIGGKHGPLLLHCDDAELINAPTEYRDLPERSKWVRRIEWAGILPENVLYVALAGGTNLLICIGQLRYEDEVPHQEAP